MTNEKKKSASYMCCTSRLTKWVLREPWMRFYKSDRGRTEAEQKAAQNTIKQNKIK
jgi:hypothetical protein